METDKIPTQAISEWHPITTKVDLAVLGKLGEELSECAAAVFRCIIQGIDECEPVTKKVNRDWLMDEIADVEALIQHAKNHFNLDRVRIADRRVRKFNYKMPWFNSLR